MKELRALNIEPQTDKAELLARALAPELEFLEFDQTTSLLNALRLIPKSAYNVCFISEKFSPSDWKSFWTDIVNMNRDLGCAFIQVRKEIAPGFDRLQLLDQGIDFIVSQDGTQHDKSGLTDVITNKLENSALKERVADVSSAIQILLREVDKAAEDMQRGRSASLKVNKLACDFIHTQTNLDSEVLTRYFNALSEKSTAVEPETSTAVNIPDTVLARELPRLTKNGYSGASNRVWKKLKKQHGVCPDGNEPMSKRRDGKSS